MERRAGAAPPYEMEHACFVRVLKQQPSGWLAELRVAQLVPQAALSIQTCASHRAVLRGKASTRSVIIYPPRDVLLRVVPGTDVAGQARRKAGRAGRSASCVPGSAPAGLRLGGPGGNVHGAAGSAAQGRTQPCAAPNTRPGTCQKSTARRAAVVPPDSPAAPGPSAAGS